MKRESGIGMSRTAFLTMASVMSAAAFAASLVVSDHVFLRAPHNNDEFSYLFQAHNFAEGRVSRPFPPNHPAFRNRMIIMDENVGWLSRYPFAHALYLVPGVVLGDPYIMSALAAGLSVLLLCLTGRLLGGDAVGIAAGLALLVSPLRIIYGGTLLSHTSGLLKASLMLFAYAQWRLSNRHFFALLAGLAWALLFNNRSYTALLIAIPFGLDALGAAWRERTPRRLVGVGCFAVSAMAGVVMLLVYNHLAVGDYGTMTYLYYTQTERLGFGPRRYGRVEHTLQRGLEMLVTRVGSLDTWLWGFAGSLVVWLGMLVIGWKRHWSRLCLAAVVCVCVGYVYFWYFGCMDAGPAYYYETLPFLALGAAFGIAKLVDRFGWRACSAGLAVVLFFGSALVARTGIEIRARNTPRSKILRAIRDAPSRSLIYIDPSDHAEAYKDGYMLNYNPRGLDGDSVVALWIPEAHYGMTGYFTNHAPYKLIADEQGECRLIPISPGDYSFAVRHAASRGHRLTGRNEDGTEHDRGILRVARDGVHAEGCLFFGRYTFVAPGRYVMECELKTQNTTDEQPVASLDVAIDGGRIILGEKSVMGNGGWRTVRMEFETTGFHMIEPRVWYSGRGTVFIASLELRK